MNPLVVDTDVVSYLHKSHPTLKPAYAGLLRRYYVVISFMTLAEAVLWPMRANWGVRRSDELERYLARFTVIYPDDNMCRQWARVRHDSFRRGRPISPQDAWIAATALRLGVPLATHNVKHYAHLPDLQIVTVKPPQVH